MCSPHAQLRAVVELDATRLIAPIDRRIFGGFLEHAGRAIYGGVFDPGSALSDERGLRRDVISALRRLGVSSVRWPGGNFASAYNWRDGVGPPQDRPRRRDPAWEQLEPNTFGTDEFRAWCAQVGAEPVITVNLGDRSPEQAAAWVAYCNSQRPSLRLGGQPNQLSNVPLWCLGNEIDGPWQVGHTTADRYAQRAVRTAKLMRAVDPDIRLVLAGSSADFLPTYMHWDRAVLEAAWEHADYLGIHRYSHNRSGDTPWFLAEGVAIDRVITDFARLLHQMQAEKRSSKPVHLAIDEWNIWYRAKGPQHERGGWRTGAPLLQEGYNLEDALVVGQYLASFLRHADVVKLACLAQIVNVLAPIVTTPAGILKQTIYHAFALFAGHARGHAVHARLESPTYDAGERGQVPALDVAATLALDTSNSRANGGLSASASATVSEQWSVFLTNRLIDQPLSVRLRFTGRIPQRALEAWQIAGDDPHAANTFAEPDRIAPVAIALPAVEDGEALIELPPLSLTLLTFT